MARLHGSEFISGGPKIGHSNKNSDKNPSFSGAPPRTPLGGFTAPLLASRKNIFLTTAQALHSFVPVLYDPTDGTSFPLSKDSGFACYVRKLWQKIMSAGNA